MTQNNSNSMVINSPYKEPDKHWQYEAEHKRFIEVPGRRKAGYTITRGDDRYDEFVPIEIADKIRERLKLWRGTDYLGATPITKKLLEHWHDREARQYPFFYCQLEAIESLIFLNEAPKN